LSLVAELLDILLVAVGSTTTIGTVNAEKTIAATGPTVGVGEGIISGGLVGGDNVVARCAVVAAWGSHGAW